MSLFIHLIDCAVWIFGFFGFVVLNDENRELVLASVSSLIAVFLLSFQIASYNWIQL
jgi:hypothetical protein